MKRQEFIKAVADILKLDIKSAKGTIEDIEKVILDTVKSDPIGTVTFAGAEYGRKIVKGRSGVMNGVEWETDDKTVGCVKAKSVLKDLK